MAITTTALLRLGMTPHPKALLRTKLCMGGPLPYISAALDDIKGQVKVMSDDNLPFWTLVLSWVKGYWWKTIFTIVIVALIGLLCALYFTMYYELCNQPKG